MKSLQKQVLAWKQNKWLGVLPPEPEQRVVEVFQRFGLHPSPQVLEMYSVLGGLEIMDDQDWRLWSLKDIEAEFPDENIDRGIQFSDYLICCWCFRLKPAPSGEMEVVLDTFDGKHLVVAKDLSAFFDAYVTDPDSVLNPTPNHALNTDGLGQRTLGASPKSAG